LTKQNQHNWITLGAILVANIPKIYLTLAVLCLAALNFCTAQTLPSFNVKNYGATGNGTTLDSPSINNAIAAAGAAGGGTVTFPAGNYLCGSIHLTNCPANLTLYLSNNAVILASGTAIDTEEANPWSQYQDEGHSYFHNSLIWGENLTSFTIAGSGKIDGANNLVAHPSSSVPTGQGDKGLCLVSCTSITITGVTITNGGWFGLFIDGCSNVLVTGMQIMDANQRDGFDLIDSSDAVITNCVIQGSDDALAIKSTYALGRKIGCQHILVINDYILSSDSDATTIGSETVGNFNDITFTNLLLSAPQVKAGIGMTSNDGGVIDGLTYDNITLSNCICPIFIKLNYRTTDTPNPSVGGIQNISFNHITDVVGNLGVDTSTINGFFDGTNTIIPIRNLTFNNVTVLNKGGSSVSAITNYPVENQLWPVEHFGSWPSYGWYIRWATNINFTNCQVHFTSNDGRPAVMVDSSTNVSFYNFTADVGSANTNYDLGFLNSASFVVTNAVASASAPTPGAALRIFSGNPLPQFPFLAQNLACVTNGAIAALQADANFPSGNWLQFSATATNQWITYTIPSLDAGTYDVKLLWKANSNRGILTFALDGTILGNPLDQYASSVIYPTTDYGLVSITNSGSHTIQLTAVGKNLSSSGYALSAYEFLFTQFQAGRPQRPSMSTFASAGANLIFSGSNGIPQTSCCVLMSTNLSLPLSAWTAVQTNGFDASGNFISTNPMAPNAPQQFYRLKLPLPQLP
jgi:polygalacturonase